MHRANRPVITYCAGCTGKLQKYLPAVHLLDVVFHGDAAFAGRRKASGGPLTCWNRIQLKQTLKKDHPAPVTRERTFNADPRRNRAAAFKKRLLLAWERTVGKSWP